MHHFDKGGGCKCIYLHFFASHFLQSQLAPPPPPSPAMRCHPPLKSVESGGGGGLLGVEMLTPPPPPPCAPLCTVEGITSGLHLSVL